MCEVEAAQEDGGRGTNLRRQAAELGGAQRLDRVVPQQLFLLSRGEEVRQRRDRCGGSIGIATGSGREEVVGDIGGGGSGAHAGDWGVGSRGVGGDGGGRRGGGKALADGLFSQAICFRACVGELRRREGPFPEL